MVISSDETVRRIGEISASEKDVNKLQGRDSRRLLGISKSRRIKQFRLSNAV